MSKVSLFEKMADAYSKRNHAVRKVDELQRRVSEMEGLTLDDAQKAAYAKMLLRKNKAVQDAGLAQQQIDLLPAKRRQELYDDAVNWNATLNDRAAEELDDYYLGYDWLRENLRNPGFYSPIPPQADDGYYIEKAFEDPYSH